MEMDQQELVDSLVKEHAAINKLAASILEDKHQVHNAYGNTVNVYAMFRW